VRLPVEETRENLTAALAGRAPGRVLLRAPTGSGKSTRVPGMLVESGVSAGRVLVVQPRRIAARMLAEFVARSAGTKVGANVGYAVRFESRYSAATRIVYVTDGVLQRWMREDPGLSGVGAVIFDEFHERRLASEIALARVMDLQEATRPELKVVVMSATLEVAGLADYLAPCEVVETSGREHPVGIVHRRDPPPKRGRSGRVEPAPVWVRAVEACREEVTAMERDEKDGGGGTVPPRILIFMPGAFEIRKTQELLERASWRRGWEVKPLYSALAPQRQWEAVSESGGPRIIVSTNVAETSITIDGVRRVIDSGLARIACYDTRRGIDTLTIGKISRAAAEQRAGRAGRTGPGRCVRLWSEADHVRRAAFETPEVRRVDLAEAVLYLKAAGVEDPRWFRWLDAPDEQSLERAEKLLDFLGATDRQGALTDVGRRLARYPLHPRAARLLDAAQAEGCAAEGCFVAAVLQSEGVFARGATRSQRGEFQRDGDRSDFEADWRACEVAEGMRFDAGRCGVLGIQARRCRETLQVWRQLCGLAGRPEARPGHVDFEAHRERLARAMLAAFGDHVAQRVSEGSLTCRVVGGRRGKLDEASVARGGRLFAAAELTEVEGRELQAHLSHGVVVEEEWLRELFPEAWKSEAAVVFDEQARRVTARRRVLYHDLVLEEKDGGEVPEDTAAALLAERVLDGTLKLKKWDGRVERWLARVAFVAETTPELGLDPIGEEGKRILLERVCRGAKSYREIKEREVWPALREWLSAAQAGALEHHAPERIRLPNGVEAKVRYEAGAPPTIALRVQQLYGVEVTPRIAGRPVRVQVLAPNQRPWQVTQDLPSFWKNGYPQMKKDLAGRYPKHEWR